MGLFDKFKRGLTKTNRLLKTDVRDLFRSEGRLIDDAFLDEMRALLFKTDMGYDSVEQIVDEVATAFRGRVVTLEEVVTTWKTKLEGASGAAKEEAEQELAYAEDDVEYYGTYGNYRWADDLARKSLAVGIQATERLAMAHADLLLHRRFAQEQQIRIRHRFVSSHVLRNAGRDQRNDEPQRQERARMPSNHFTFSQGLPRRGACLLPYRLLQNSALPGVRGNAMTSRIFAMPVTNWITRSNPKPNPA